jgi:acetyl esterase/lipase
MRQGATPMIQIASAQKAAAIRLPGRSANPAPETWVEIENGLPPGGEIGGVPRFGRPELWVWNVSEPTLEPFLPEPSVATGAAMIVAPGGAFMGLAIDREGYSVARWLNEHGIAAFVLKYRILPMPRDSREATTQVVERIRHAQGSGPLADRAKALFQDALVTAREDGADAVRHVRTEAQRWGLSAHRIGMIGFSAGAVLAVDVALKADRMSRPDLVASIYGSLPAETKGDALPPAFIAVAADDNVASGSIAIYSAWRTRGVAAELHVFEGGGHGFGVVQQGRGSDHWLQPFEHWLAAHEFLRSES